MMFDNPAARTAYLAGVQKTIDYAIIYLDGPQAMELATWLSELKQWMDGDPPPAPQDWR